MIDTVASVNLMVEDTLKIKKNRLMPDFTTGNEKRICLVSGTYGDELQGQYVCYEVIRRIKENFDKLAGIVDVYPSINPLGMEAKTRDIPFIKLDMNELFPGTRSGTVGEYIASCLVDDMLESEDGPKAEFCLDIHGSNMYIHEIPQIRLNDDVVDDLFPYVSRLNTDMVWVHPSNQVKNGSLCYELNARGINSCVTESCYAYEISQEYGNQLVDGIFAVMHDMGIWKGECPTVKSPVLTGDDRMIYLNSETSGIFLPDVRLHDTVSRGQRIGRVVNVITGSVEQQIVSTESGMVCGLRAYPAIEVGSLLARIVADESVVKTKKSFSFGSGILSMFRKGGEA